MLLSNFARSLMAVLTMELDSLNAVLNIVLAALRAALLVVLLSCSAEVTALNASLTWRVHKQHAIAVKYQFSRRDANFPDLGDRTQSRGTIGIFYTLLGRDRFGTSDWR